MEPKDAGSPTPGGPVPAASDSKDNERTIKARKDVLELDRLLNEVENLNGDTEGNNATPDISNS